MTCPRQLLDAAAEFGSTPAGQPYAYPSGVEQEPKRSLPGSVLDEALDH